jgi:nucleotide-binding universal stress UspA family protein
MTYAWDLAEKTDAALHVLHVNDRLWNEGPLASARPENTIDGMRHLLEEQIAELQRRGKRRRLAYPLFATGEPAREILACVGRIAADIIIMGTHGRGQVGRLPLGSVTHEVLEHTVRPVLVTHSAV